MSNREEPSPPLARTVAVVIVVGASDKGGEGGPGKAVLPLLVLLPASKNRIRG